MYRGVATSAKEVVDNSVKNVARNAVGLCVSSVDNPFHRVCGTSYTRVIPRIHHWTAYGSAIYLKLLLKVALLGTNRVLVKAMMRGRVHRMVEGVFSEDGIEQAKRLLDEIEAGLPRRMGGTGTVIGDPQTVSLVRVLRILTDQIEQLRAECAG